jgi:hypothetical protein
VWQIYNRLKWRKISVDNYPNPKYTNRVVN